MFSFSQLLVSMAFVKNDLMWFCSAITADALTPLSNKPCGSIFPQLRPGAPYCFSVDIFELSEGISLGAGPAQSAKKIGQGVLIDENLVSTSASIFFVENQ
jgi:hypothetical protein